MDIRFRPLVGWPGERTRQPQRSRFDSPYSYTLELLERELEHVGAREIIIQLDLEERDIRLDGLPRANARPGHQGVVIAFESKYGPLKYATDTFDDWQDNIRAIALGLEALRKVERYGITKRGEQYTGWKALPASTQPVMSTKQAAAFMAVHGSDGHGRSISDTLILERPGIYETAFRSAAKRLHPDLGWSTEKLQQLQEAKRILDAHHGKEVR